MKAIPPPFTITQNLPLAPSKVEIDKLSRFDLRNDVKVLAIAPSKQEVIVGVMNMLRLLKIEPDLSIKTIVRNIGINK